MAMFSSRRWRGGLIKTLEVQTWRDQGRPRPLPIPRAFAPSQGGMAPAGSLLSEGAGRVPPTPGGSCSRHRRAALQLGVLRGWKPGGAEGGSWLPGASQSSKIDGLTDSWQKGSPGETQLLQQASWLSEPSLSAAIYPSMVQASRAQPPTLSLGAAMTQPPPTKAPAKKHVRLQERRGSSVALMLDVRSLGAVEPICSVNTPREVTIHFLRTAGHPLTRWGLQHQPPSPKQLEEEFLKIPSNFVSPEDLDIPGHASKDRYKTILPNPQSRVCLGRAQSQEDGDYINANYIRGYDGQEKVYIATQGPMPNTVADFWEMVWQEEVCLIVMLTQLREGKEKCVHYWPTDEETYGPFQIRIQSMKEHPEYTVRQLTIQHQEERRSVKHILFSAWPDHQTPESAGPLLRLMAEVESPETAANPGPIVVHCSAGIGRTGCFIATRIGCQQLKARGEVDILGIVCQLRLDRGGMIQTAEQYQFLHHTLALYAAQLPQEPSP